MLYILDGKTPVPVSREDYAKIVANWSEGWWRIALDDVKGVIISTVFLGIDYGGGKNPLLFETEVFISEAHTLDEYTRRYATWDEAVAGHNDVVAMVKEMLEDTTPDTDQKT